jgi:2'-5' RNA ligase
MERESWRMFVAIPVPPAVQEELARVQNELRIALPEKCLRFTRKEGLHLTLRFLGNVDATRVPELTAALQVSVTHIPAMPLKCERIGFFPGPRYPRVVWAWVHDEADQLSRLQREVEEAVRPFHSESMEKTFTGHVTLARCASIRRPEAEGLLRMAQGMTERVFGEWTAGELHLIRSQLGQGGSQYTVLATIPLAAHGSFGRLPPA